MKYNSLTYQKETLITNNFCCKLVIIFALIFCTGCSSAQTGIDSLLSPPRLSDQQDEIYNALLSTVGSNIKLRYPKYGEHTSAFLIQDLDGDKEPEAIVFYENTIATSQTMPIRLNVLDQQSDGTWVSKYELGVEATDVDKISFVQSNGKKYIVISYNVLSLSEKVIKIYTYETGILKETASLNCMSYAVADMDQDGESELITFVKTKSSYGIDNTIAVMHKIDNIGTKIISQATLEPNVASIIDVYEGVMPNGNPALYIDAARGTHTIYTEILEYSDNYMINAMYNELSDKFAIDMTFRNQGSFLMDLNGDNIYEIPIPRPDYGNYTPVNGQELYPTEWYNYEEYTLNRYSTTYVSYSLGYIFTLPDEWLENVRAYLISSDNELVLYDNSVSEDSEMNLISIKVFRRNDYEELINKDGYQILIDNGQILYTYKFYDTNSELEVTTQIIKDKFALISDLKGVIL